VTSEANLPMLAAFKDICEHCRPAMLPFISGE
jgi:hypothetical protein